MPHSAGTGELHKAPASRLDPAHPVQKYQRNFAFFAYDHTHGKGVFDMRLSFQYTLTPMVSTPFSAQTQDEVPVLLLQVHGLHRALQDGKQDCGIRHTPRNHTWLI